MIIIVIIHPYHQQRHHNHHSYLIIPSVITNGNTIDISKIKIAIFITATQAFHFFALLIVCTSLVPVKPDALLHNVSSLWLRLHFFRKSGQIIAISYLLICRLRGQCMISTGNRRSPINRPANSSKAVSQKSVLSKTS